MEEVLEGAWFELFGAELLYGVEVYKVIWF